MQFPITPLTILAAFLTGALGAYLAHRRGRNPFIWFAIGFFFGLLGAFAIFFAPSRKKSDTLKGEERKEEARLEILPPVIQGPADKFWYYLGPDHQQVGPMSLDALTVAWRQGKVSLNTYVWNEELPDWKPLQDLLPKITSSP